MSPSLYRKLVETFCGCMCAHCTAYIGMVHVLKIDLETSPLLVRFLVTNANVEDLTKHSYGRPKRSFGRSICDAVLFYEASTLHKKPSAFRKKPSRSFSVLCAVKASCEIQQMPQVIKVTELYLQTLSATHSYIKSLIDLNKETKS